MRSCVYCGRTLEKGEKCNCPQSVRAREAKNQSYNYTKSEEQSQSFNDTYETGYTRKEKKKHFEKIKRAWRQRKRDRRTSSGFKNLILSFLKNPVSRIATPSYLSPLQIVLMVLATGMVLAGGGYFLASFLGTVINVLSQSVAVPVISEYSFTGFLFTAIFGGLALVLSVFVVFFVFWCIDRFILKRTTPFFGFSIRLSYATIPVLIFGIIGIVVGFFSVYALLMFYIAGLVMWIILTYEALSYEWNFVDKSKVFYFVSLGLIFAIIIGFNILRF